MDDLAGALADRLFARAGLGAATEATFASALGRLEGLFKSAGMADPISRLGTLLQPQWEMSERGAIDIAERLAACLPSERGLAAAALGNTDLARSAEQELQRRWTGGGSSVLPQSNRLDPEKLLAAIAKALDGEGTAGQAAGRLWGQLRGMTADLTVTAAVSGASWTAGDAQDLLRKQLAKWIRNISDLGGLPDRTLAVAKAIEFELNFRLPVRLAVATVLSAGGVALYGTKELIDDIKQVTLGRGSTPMLGQQVHSTLQLRYRARPTRMFDLIEQDDRVFGLQQSTLAAGVPLESVAFTPTHSELLALYLARQSLKAVNAPFLPDDAPIKRAAGLIGWSLRDDNTNFTDARIFEIKPVRGAWLGVLQEMYYRAAFNMWTAIMQDLESVGTAISKLVGRTIGPLAFSCDTLYGGTASDWPEVNTAEGGVLAVPSGGSNFTIMVTQVDALPGLVMYWNFDLPVLAVRLLYDTIRDAVNKIAEKTKKWTIEALTWITALAIATVGVLLLVAAVTSGAAELAVLFAALEEAGPAVVAGIKGFYEALVLLAPEWSLSTVSDAATGRVALRLDPTTPPAGGYVATGIQIGFLRLDNVPVDAGKYAGALVQGGLQLVRYACDNSPQPSNNA